MASGIFKWRGLSAREEQFLSCLAVGSPSPPRNWPAALMAPCCAANRPRIRSGSKLFFLPTRCHTRIVLSVACHLSGGPCCSSPPYFGGFSICCTPFLGARNARAARVVALGFGLMPARLPLWCVDCHRRRSSESQRSFEKKRLGRALAFSAGGFHRHVSYECTCSIPLHPFCSRCTRQHGSAVPAVISQSAWQKVTVGRRLRTATVISKPPFLALKPAFALEHSAANLPFPEHCSSGH